MIRYTTGNLLEASTEALVNTVNCVGVMGKGIALQFKQAYPKCFSEYQKACKMNEVRPGKMHVVNLDSLFNPKYIINFPTKRHWKEKSNIEDIKAGLIDLINVIKQQNIKSIAIPPLGCGNGGLNWAEVRPIILAAMEQVPDTEVLLFEPNNAPSPDKMKIGTTKPNMTKTRALFISLMNQYKLPGYRLSLLEIQKLAYFLQEVGEPMRLNFEKGKYGPYAEVLNHVLQRLEGHYIRGYGDRSSKAEVYLLENASEEAKKVLINEPEALKKLEMVNELIYGFETPYGLELLSTVHWVVKQDPKFLENKELVVTEVHNWNEHKKQRLQPNHILKAVEHINEIFSYK
ncbi:MULTISPECIES: macro domain-containing protein [Bacillus]|uniref:type II toxin-antitoxin system antitoxin DNA ADP-ribosyl glycohydrolase DarG n=1 Tax=Bacillus TaxID=1386 RepID=UPI001E42648B|nr:MULTISPECIES: macro domain-containing protein [Bacillus]MDA1742464.1 macro domain-containing protein [Bacillus cereus]MDA1849737.1 macro domain-containing protein [Bacillus cereus]UEP95629.1 macro domain-containing protein [Bacillus pacificus]WNV18931.1 macro domain-containing protein [Bacillus sp. SI2]HDR7897931.1 macro domain-containing protein [Bacillus pacificus]